MKVQNMTVALYNVSLLNDEDSVTTSILADCLEDAAQQTGELLRGSSYNKAYILRHGVLLGKVADEKWYAVRNPERSKKF